MQNIIHFFAKRPEPKPTWADELLKWNNQIRDFLMPYRWYVYMLTAILMTYHTCCYLRSLKRKLYLKKLQQQLQQKFKPGVHKKSYVIVKSPTGIIYGAFDDGPKKKFDVLYKCNCYANEKTN